MNRQINTNITGSASMQWHVNNDKRDTTKVHQVWIWLRHGATETSRFVLRSVVRANGKVGFWPPHFYTIVDNGIAARQSLESGTCFAKVWPRNRTVKWELGVANYAGGLFRRSSHYLYSLVAVTLICATTRRYCGKGREIILPRTVGVDSWTLIWILIWAKS